MRSIWLQFEIKLLLAFGVVLLAVLYFGSGSISFEEAKLKANEDNYAISPGLLSKLKKKQAKFTKMAFPPCIESTGMVPQNFTVVIEVGSKGYVARSWRQGDSVFVICFQRLLTDNFIFRSIGKPFFTSFEYSNAP